MAMDRLLRQDCRLLVNWAGTPHAYRCRAALQRPALCAVPHTSAKRHLRAAALPPLPPALSRSLGISPGRDASVKKASNRLGANKLKATPRRRWHQAKRPPAQRKESTAYHGTSFPCQQTARGRYQKSMQYCVLWQHRWCVPHFKCARIGAAQRGTACAQKGQAQAGYSKRPHHSAAPASKGPK